MDVIHASSDGSIRLHYGWLNGGSRVTGGARSAGVLTGCWLAGAVVVLGAASCRVVVVVMGRGVADGIGKVAQLLGQGCHGALWESGMGEEPCEMSPKEKGVLSPMLP